MALPGLTDEKEIKLLLKKLLTDSTEAFKLAVIAFGPKEGYLLMSKQAKLKRKEVLSEASAEARENNGGKNVPLDVLTGECRLHKPETTILRVIAYGKAPAKAVACVEHLLTRGAYKSCGFTGVVIEEVDESDESPESGVEPSGVASTTTASTPAGDLAGPITERLKELKPELDEAITAGSTLGQQVKLLTSELGVAIRKKDFARAGELLDYVETLLRRGTVDGEPGNAPSMSKSPEPGEVREGVVDYAKCRLAWDSAKKKVQGDLQELERAILKEYRGSEAWQELVTKIRKLDAVLANFSEGLGDALDAALNATDSADRKRHHDRATQIVARYAHYVETDSLIARLELNPFVPLSIQKSLGTTLAALTKRLV